MFAGFNRKGSLNTETGSHATRYMYIHVLVHVYTCIICGANVLKWGFTFIVEDGN